MADFWIKLEKGTPDKPEVYEIASILGIDPDAALGKLIRVWCWADSNSENGHIKSVTNVLIDRITMSQGFADAMKAVGWLADEEIPNFDRHLGDSAKKRAKDAERKRKSRDCADKCHTKSVTESGLDKSRVDNIKTPLPPEGDQCSGGESSDEPTGQPKIPPCPHMEIISAYHEILPELQGVVTDRWIGSVRARDLQARWRESPKHQSVDFWRRYFAQVRTFPHQMGENDRNWRADLGWLIKRSNFDKMIERILARQA